jgi:glycosyltransferase involved in cell wall biosynthesis
MAQERKRVLFLVPSLIGGGAQRVFSILLRHLDRSRFEPHLAMVQATGTYLEDIPADVVIHDLNISRVRYAAPAIVRVIRKVQPQTVLATLGHVNLTLMAIKPLLPKSTKLLIREAAVATAFLDLEVKHPAIWRWLYRHLYRRADKIVCLSDSMVEDMVQNFGLPRTKLARIYNPMDTEHIREFAEQQHNPYSGSGPHLVSVGRLCRQKGYDILLNAMPEVLKQMPGTTLSIVGEGPLESELKEQARKLLLKQSVRFTGFQQNPWAYVKHADLFVLSSRYEGMPNVILEAFALGTPIVAADCPGAVRELQQFNDQMILVPSENPEALARAIISASRLGRRQPSENRLTQFNVEQITEEYSKLF